MAILSSYSHPHTTTDSDTISTRGYCQHQHEPIQHSRNSPNKEYDQSEDRKRLMNTNPWNVGLQFGDVLSQEICMEFQLEEQQRQDMIHPFHLQRTKFFASMTLAHLLIAASRIENMPCLQIDFFADKGKNKSKVFLSQGLQGYHTFPCNGTQRSNRFHSKRLLRSMALNSAGLRQRSRDSHIEGLQRSETFHFAGSRQSDRSHSYRSEALPRSQTFNFVGQPTFENSRSHMNEGLQRSKNSQNESLTGSNTVHYEGLHRLNKLYSHSFNDSTHRLFEGTQGINRVLQNALQALILQISLILTITRKYRHVFILIAFLTRAACTDVQVPINCTSAAVMTSPAYPFPYQEDENIQWSVTAPEGKRILLTFNNFSLGSSGDVKVIEKVSDRKRQRYIGEKNIFPPFLSRRNSLLLRFTSDGTPTGKGFNISASCFKLSGTRVGRLMGGNTPAEGFLELQAESGAKWMRVCEDPSADRLADVVCEELGFPGAKEVSYVQGWCSSEGAGPVCIRAHSCDNYTYHSQDCSASSNECNSSLAVKVKCFEPGFKGCYDLGNTQLKNGYSYESTSQCITLCRADTSQAIAIINGSKCFCSTTDDIGLSSFSRVEDQSCAPHQLVYNASFGFCNLPKDVMNGSWDYDTTWFGSFVNLTCNQGYWLNGSGTLQCVTEVSSYLPVWTGSIPTCEMITDITSSATSGQDTNVIAISSSVTALFMCIICAAIWKCRGRKINKKRAAPSITAIGESDQTNATRALPQPPDEESLPNILLNRSQHVTRTPHNLNNSSTLHPSLELTAFQHGNNNYTPSNPYHYAISMTHPPQVTPNMGNPVNAYELGDSIDRNANGSEHRTEMMPMFNRPLPHRPISIGVQEGPSLPPRERRGIHSSTLSPNLRQNARSDNSHLGACSMNHNSPTHGEQGEAVNQMPRNCAITKEVVVIYPFKCTTSNENAHHGYYSADDLEQEDVHNGGNFPMSPSKLYPFYHCLGDDDQQTCSNGCDTDVLINNGSNAPDDYLVEVMVDNVLYNPMDF